MHNARDHLVIDIPTLIQPPHVKRVAVLWDPDADTRVLSVRASRILQLTNAAIRISRDKWTTEAKLIERTPDGKAVRAAIEANEQLRIIPERFTLGRGAA